MFFFKWGIFLDFENVQNISIGVTFMFYIDLINFKRVLEIGH